LTAFLIAQELATTFRGEHEVNDDVGEGLGHGIYWLAELYRVALVGQSCVKMSRPYRAWSFGDGIPGPSARAITWQAYGPFGSARETSVNFCSPRHKPKMFPSAGLCDRLIRVIGL
jgi:hypothetical protein